MINTSAAILPEIYLKKGKGGIPVSEYFAGFAYWVKKLFASNEIGFAYDPNDLSTMFQDAAGTVPVTGVGQIVGLMLDKSKGLVYGSERITGGNFESGLIGTKSDGSGSASTWTLNTNNPIYGTQDGNLIITTATTGAFPRLTFSSPAKVVGALYEITFNYKVNSGTAVISQVYNGSGTQVVNLSLTGNGIAKIKYIAVGTSANELLYFGNSLCNIQIDNFSCKQLLGNHAYQTNASSRPLLQRNATTGAYYLAFDGSDDFLVTNNIDFTATDKVSLFAGVQKLSDAGTGTVCELGTAAETTKSAFVLFAPAANGGNHYNFRSFGSSGAVSGTVVTTAYPAPNSAVLTAYAKISTPLCSLSINRASPLLIAQSQGTGNYGNYPLYIGRRAGTSLPFNGHIYGLIGIGKLASDTETAAIEKVLAKQLGVTLP